MKIDADKRSRNVEPAPEAERAARRARRAIARAEARAGKALATIERRRSYLLSGCRSVHAWARRAGFGPRQTRRLLRLGRTLLDEPDLEEDVARGDVPAETAADVGEVLREQKLGLGEEEREKWKRKAREEEPDKVRDDAEQAVEDARQGAPTFPLRFRVTKKTRDGLRRVRLLMGRGQRVLPTDNEVLGRLVRDYLLRHDPREKPVPARPSGRSAHRSRRVPRQVRALVERRSGGTCEICRARPAFELVHLKPWAQGGSNEPDNLAHACRDCHVLLDGGAFTFSHFDEAGAPVFSVRRDRFEAEPPGAPQGDQEGHDERRERAGRREPGCDQCGGDEHGGDGCDAAPSSVRERAPPYRAGGSRRPGRRGVARAAGPP